jgi:hypothetical protein
MFPAPWPTGNPYVGAAEGAGSAAASIYNSLVSAANQKGNLIARQQQQQTVQAHQDLQDQLRAFSEGWIPADKETRLPGGLIDRTQPSTQGQDPSRILNVGGKRMYKPTEQESGKAFVPTGGLADALKSAGWDGKNPITPEHSHSILLALEAAQPKDEGWDIDVSGKFKDPQGNPVPVAIGRKSHKVTVLNMGGMAPQGYADQNLPEGNLPGGPTVENAQRAPQPQQQAPQGAGSPGGPFSFALPEKPEKEPPRKEPHYADSDRGDVTGIVFDPASGTFTKGATFKGVGTQHKDPNAAAGPKPPTAAALRSIRQRKDRDITAANSAFKRAISTADEGSPERSQAVSDYHDALRKAQEDYEQNISEATGNDIPHDPWADNLPDTYRIPGAGATATPAQPVKTAPAQPAVQATAGRGRGGKLPDPLGIR